MAVASAVLPGGGGAVGETCGSDRPSGAGRRGRAARVGALSAGFGLSAGGSASGLANALGKAGRVGRTGAGAGPCAREGASSVAWAIDCDGGRRWGALSGVGATVGSGNVGAVSARGAGAVSGAVVQRSASAARLSGAGCSVTRSAPPAPCPCVPPELSPRPATTPAWTAAERPRKAAISAARLMAAP